MPFKLIASESTVQVLSPTVVNDVLYCTIEVTPYGVIASRPIPPVDATGAIGAIEASFPLMQYSAAITDVMKHDHVIGGVGEQTLDASGLLQDGVRFTVQYIPPGQTDSDITADVVIPNTVLLDTTTADVLGEPIPVLNPAASLAMIDATYQGLVAVAGG